MDPCINSVQRRGSLEEEWEVFEDVCGDCMILLSLMCWVCFGHPDLVKTTGRFVSVNIYVILLF